MNLHSTAPTLASRPALATRASGPDAHPVPQADRIEKVAAAVDAVAAGCDTAATIADALGMVGRQGAYYPNAAAFLGLLEIAHPSAPVIWQLSPLGAAFAEMAASKRAEALCAAIESSGIVDTYTLQGSDALRAEWAAYGLSEATIERRLQTAEAWTSFYVDAGRAEQAQRLAEAQAAARAQAVGAKERAGRRAPRRQRSVKHTSQHRYTRRCPICAVALPSGSDACDLCG